MKWLLLALVITTILVMGCLYVERKLAIDTCLDHGGSWNDAQGQCIESFERSPPRHRGFAGGVDIERLSALRSNTPASASSPLSRPPTTSHSRVGRKQDRCATRRVRRRLTDGGGFAPLRAPQPRGRTADSESKAYRHETKH